jgi:nitroimidazol reductase NimA-like FMN-containing flavoprotein (pyridoxamine 5'-phosphate oxidase superfamily)
MDGSSDQRQTLKQVFAAQRFCVLATQGQGQPYGSLVAFAETEDLKGLVFATERNTRKFSNMMSEPRVAMVIDSRSNKDADLRNAVAITALGPVHEAAGDEREHLVALYLAKHPGLEKFVGSPGMAVCVIAVKDYVIATFSGVTRLQVGL